jgi:hypothetical protein
LILFGALFLPSVAPVSQQDFWFFFFFFKVSKFL